MRRTAVALCILLLLACSPKQARTAAVEDSVARFPQEGVGTVVVPIPEYPDLANRAGIEGQTIVSSVAMADGLVERARVWKSSGNPLLDEASLEAVGQARLVFSEKAFPRPFLLDITFRYNRQHGAQVTVEEVYLREE